MQTLRVETCTFKKIAVLGAGVMGAQIAAHFANAHISVTLFDLPSEGESRNKIVIEALNSLKKMEPSPLVSIKSLNYITPANYDNNLIDLKNCDLIIEAISERMDIKQNLFKKIEPYLSNTCILASNTSGLSITELAKLFEPQLATRFCGIHFFNPPRYMPLVEVIPHANTSTAVLNDLEEFLTSHIGKGVIRAKDTPNFIANRIGVFSLLSTIFHAKKFGLNYETADALTGSFLGRPKSATFRTLDVVGLDTLDHVIKTMETSLKADSWSFLYKTPDDIAHLLNCHHFGQKTGKGFFQKKGKDILVFDFETKSYRTIDVKTDPEVVKILTMKSPSEKFRCLINSSLPQAKFIWCLYRDLFHYCSVNLASIAHSAREVDLALRWGFGWEKGPFEIWQDIGWQEVTLQIHKEIENKFTLSSQPLPDWVYAQTAVHKETGSFSAYSLKFEPASTLSVYKRQLWPEPNLENKNLPGKTIFETEGFRLWTLDDEVCIASFKSKMHAIGKDILNGLLESISIAEKNYKGLILWQPKAPFSAGAHLGEIVKCLESNNEVVLKDMLSKFQKVSMALKQSSVPTIAAIQGLVLGGGCEFMMHCTKTVAHIESYVGLVEAGVGLLPAGGGCKEFVLRASQESKGNNPFPFLQKYFENIAKAKISKSAVEAKEFGFLKPSDTIIFNSNELLHVAHSEINNLYESCYRPFPTAIDIVAGGRDSVATLQTQLVNLKEGQFISEHDFEVTMRIANIFGGGNIDGGTLISENWLLELESKYFLELLALPKTHERIKYMLANGKPLRN